MRGKVLPTLFLILFSISVFGAETAPIAVIEMNETSIINVLANGDAEVTENIALTATAYAAFKQQYPTLSMFARIFEPKSMPLQIENLNIQVDEFNNKIVATYTIKGMAVNKESYWEIIVAPEGLKTTLSAQTENAFVFTYADQSGGYNKMITTTINLPEGAENISFDPESNKVKYGLIYLPDFGGAAFGNIIFLAVAILALIGAIINQKLKY